MTSLLQGNPGSTAAIGLVAILTVQVINDSISSPVEKPCSPYQNEDGEATQASQREAESVFRRRAGYALTCLVAIAIQSLRNVAPGPYSSLPVLIWILLIIQVAFILRKDDPFRLHKHLRSVLASSLCIFAHFAYKQYLQPGSKNNAIYLATITIVSLLLLSLPRRPVVYVEGQEVLDRNGASPLSYVFFSYSFLSRKTSSRLPDKLALHDVPLPHHSLRAGQLQKHLSNLGGPGRLWLQLLRSLIGPLSKQWLAVIVKAASELGSRHALFQLLQRLEHSGEVATYQRDTWAWVRYMGIALLCDAVADSWLYWFTTGDLLTSSTSILQAVIYDKITRRQNVHSGPGVEKKPQAAGDMLFNDTNLINKAVVNSYYFPLAVFKILVDMVYLTKLLGVKSIVAGAVFPAITVFVSKKLAGKHQALQGAHAKYRSRLSAVITEALQNLRHIRLASLEDLWRKRLASAYAKEQEHRWLSNVELRKLNLVAGLGPVLLASAAISVNALETGQLSPSVAFTAVNLFGALYDVFTELPAKVAAVHKSLITCQRLEGYLHQPDQIKASVASESILLEQACLAWHSSANSEDASNFQLRDVTLDFPRGKLSLVTGNVGSGKSLLLAALLDEATLVSGRFEKPPIHASKDENQGLVIGSTAYVSQPPWIDSGSIKENIIFGYPFDQERYNLVLTCCALRDDLKSMRDGDSTAAGEGGSSLSGGQKWRVALARALYSPAEIVVLEDVLSAVDTPVASWICECALTGELAHGRTIILATHRPEFCTTFASYVVHVDAATAKGTTKVAQVVGRTTPDDKEKSSADHAETQVKATPVDKAQTNRSVKSPPAAKKRAIHTLYAYILSGGISLYLFSALVTVCYQGLNASHTWWLARWTSAVQNDASRQNVTVGSVIVYLLLSISGTVALAVQSLVFVHIGMTAATSAFTAAVNSMLGATLGWIDNTPFGGLFQSLDHDMHLLDDLIAPSLNGIFGTILQLTMIIFTSTYSNPYTAVISIAVLTTYWYIGPQMTKPGQKLRPLLIPGMYPLTNHTNSTVLGLTTIRAFGQTQMYKDRMLKLVDTSATVGLHLQLGGCWTKSRAGLLSCVFVTSTAAAMTYNHIDAATTGLIITLSLQLRAAMGSLLGKMAMTRMGLTAAERVFGLTEIPHEPNRESHSNKKDRPEKGALELDNLVVRYAAELPPVVKSVSFSIEPGRHLGIVGRTGAGKTSLTNAILRFIEANEGTIRIDGVDISGLPLEELRSVVGIIPQDPFLFSGTLRENLDSRGLKSDQDLVATLRRVRLIAKGEESTGQFSDLDMPIEAGGSNLSHGQRQLICLARAMVKQHSILILDEATSSVDNATDELVQDIIKTEFGTKTVVVVAHKLTTAAAMDAVLVMAQGEAIELGSPRELLEQKGVFWDMVSQSGQQGEIERSVAAAMD